MATHSPAPPLPTVIALPPRRLLTGLRWLVVAAASLLVLHDGVRVATLQCAVILGMLLGQQTFAFWLAGRGIAIRWQWVLISLDLVGVSAATLVNVENAGYYFLLYPLILVEACWIIASTRVFGYTLAIGAGFVAAQLAGAYIQQRTFSGLDWVLLVLEFLVLFIVTGICQNVFSAWRGHLARLDQLALLDDLSLLLADTRQLDDVLASFVELVPDALDVQACVIAIDEPGSGRRIWANLGADTSALIDEALLVRPVGVPTIDASQPIIATAPDSYAVLFMQPLEIDAHAVGLLSVARVTATPFDTHDQRLLKSLARHAAQALRNARLNRLEAEDARATRDLEQMKSEMLTGVSHEFRLPLTSITLATETLLAQSATHADADLEQRLLRNIQRSAQRLSGFVQDLLDLARLEANHLDLRSQPFDLVPVVRAAAAFIEPACEMKHQRFRLQVRLAAGAMQGDLKRLEQVVNNLLANAQQYTPEGGEILLQLALADAQLPGIPDHLADAARRAALLSVHDSGPGIPVEERGTIFDRFSRGTAGRRRSSGAGLGLYIARTVVRLHGGHMWISDSPLGGSAFWCLLPLAADAPASPSRQPVLTIYEGDK